MGSLGSTGKSKSMPAEFVAAAVLATSVADATAAADAVANRVLS